LILERIKMLAYKYLFYHTFEIYREKAKEHGADAKAHQLPLPVLSAALKFNGIDMDDAEIECICANLIYNNFMRGYIAHKRCVVLSKESPFPGLTRSASPSTVTGEDFNMSADM